MKTTLYKQGGLLNGSGSTSTRSRKRMLHLIVLPILLITLALVTAGHVMIDAVTAFWYGLAVRDQWGATAGDRVDWVNDTIKMSLHTSTYTPNQDTDQYFTAATNELATAGGYTNGGATLTGKTLTYDGPSNTVRLKATGVTWSSATFTARYAVIRKDTGTGSTSHLLGYINFGADQSPAGVDFTVNGDSTDGFLRAVVS